MSSTNQFIAGIVMWAFIILGAFTDSGMGIAGVGLGIGISYLMITVGCAENKK
jgi:hypothetical protein